MVGDGAFQQIPNGYSTMCRFRQNNIVFVMNNNLYGIEQWLLNPAPFIEKDPSKISAYNDLQVWKYDKFPSVFGGNGMGLTCSTQGELTTVFQTIKNNPDAAIIVDVKVPLLNYPIEETWGLPSTT